MQVCYGPAYSDVAGVVLSGPGQGDHHELGARERLWHVDAARRTSVSATSATPPAIPWERERLGDAPTPIIIKAPAF